MTRRTLASVLVGCLLVVLFAAAVALPVPYVTMTPGRTVDILARTEGKAIIDVRGHRTYPTRGELRLTTVSVTSPSSHVGLAEALVAWVDRTEAVYPRDVIYPPDQSAEESEEEGIVEMVSSQDTAIAAALTELGYRLPLRIEILAVTKGSPAAGKLEPRDRIEEINGVRIREVDQVSKAIQKTGVGESASFVVRRNGDSRRVVVTAEAAKDDRRRAVVGVRIGTGYDFPFDVTVHVDEDIIGPSAGLVFSLAVYDTLTPGSLTGGTDIAGTGTIDDDGHVGPIGGIQQKIVAAHDVGAELFFVPPGNCAAALHADVRKDDIELVKAPTMHSAVKSLETYARNKRADLPSCR